MSCCRRCNGCQGRPRTDRPIVYGAQLQPALQPAVSNEIEPIKLSLKHQSCLFYATTNHTVNIRIHSSGVHEVHKLQILVRSTQCVCIYTYPLAIKVHTHTQTHAGAHISMHASDSSRALAHVDTSPQTIVYT